MNENLKKIDKNLTLKKSKKEQLAHAFITCALKHNHNRFLINVNLLQINLTYFENGIACRRFI